MIGKLAFHVLTVALFGIAEHLAIPLLAGRPERIQPRGFNRHEIGTFAFIAGKFEQKLLPVHPEILPVAAPRCKLLPRIVAPKYFPREHPRRIAQVWQRADAIDLSRGGSATFWRLASTSLVALAGSSGYFARAIAMDWATRRCARRSSGSRAFSAWDWLRNLSARALRLTSSSLACGLVLPALIPSPRSSRSASLARRCAFFEEAAFEIEYLVADDRGDATAQQDQLVRRELRQFLRQHQRTALL